MRPTTSAARDSSTDASDSLGDPAEVALVQDQRHRASGRSSGCFVRDGRGSSLRLSMIKSAAHLCASRRPSGYDSRCRASLSCVFGFSCPCRDSPPRSFRHPAFSGSDFESARDNSSRVFTLKIFEAADNCDPAISSSRPALGICECRQKQSLRSGRPGHRRW